MIKISVIIPVYNCEQYIEQCIKSVLCQTIRNLEIICIDDGSTDNSSNIIHQLQIEDTRIRIFQQGNQGAGLARNVGIRKAEGEYIAFLDADDHYVDCDALEKMFDMCEEKGVDICVSIRMKMWSDSVFIEELFSQESINDVLYYQEYQGDYFYQSYLFRRKPLIEKQIFFPPYRRFQDPPFFVKASYTAEKFAVVNTCLYCYRMPDARIRFNTEKTQDLLKGIIDNLEFAKKHGLDILFSRTLDHLECEFTYIIRENISPNDLNILKLLLHINQIVNEKYRDSDYIIKPLRLILFCREQYEWKLLKEIESHNVISLYGAGKLTRAFLGFLKEKGLLKKVTRIVVTDLNGNERQIDGIPVISLQEFLRGKEMYLLVTVGRKISIEIVDILKNHGYEMYEVIDELFGDILLQ